MRRIVLGTRGSALARAQAALVAARLGGAETVVISTRGDREQHAPVPELGGKGLFTAELEAALLEGRIDAAVHSLKDLPTFETPGLAVAAVMEREEWRDALVSKGGLALMALPRGAVVGTASRRRAALLRSRRNDLSIAPLRGNIDTRIGKALQGGIDAVVVAAAGLLRLGRADAIAERLDWLPAPAQGALAVQAREDRPEVLQQLQQLHHGPTARCVQAERSLLHALGGGCSVPVAALGEIAGHRVRLRALVLSLDGTRRIPAEGVGEDAAALGLVLAKNLFDHGAAEILDAPA